MHIEGWDARSVGVYKGRELPNESPPPPPNPKKKDQEKEIRKRTIRRERERERERQNSVYPCIKTSSLGELVMNHQYTCF